MGFIGGTNILKSKDYAEKMAYPEKGEKTLAERVEAMKGRVLEIMEYATIAKVADNLFREQKLSSEELSNMNPDQLEKLCDPADPAVVIAVVTHMEEQALARNKSN